MNRYKMSYAAGMNHSPTYPERTGYKNAGVGLDFDLIFQVWPNRAALRKTIDMQAKAPPSTRNWRAWVKDCEHCLSAPHREWCNRK